MLSPNVDCHVYYNSFSLINYITCKKNPFLMPFCAFLVTLWTCSFHMYIAPTRFDKKLKKNINWQNGIKHRCKLTSSHINFLRQNDPHFEFRCQCYISKYRSTMLDFVYIINLKYGLRFFQYTTPKTKITHFRKGLLHVYQHSQLI